MYTSKENSNQGHPTRQPTLVNKPGSTQRAATGFSLLHLNMN